MFKILKYFTITALLFFVFVNYKYYRSIDSSVSDQAKDVVFTIKSGESVKKIGENLVNANLINSKFYFETYIWRQNLETKVQAGDYVLSPSLSIKKIVEIITQGKTANKEREIKLLEGWTSSYMADYFDKNNIFTKTDFLNTVGWPKVDYNKEKKLPQPIDVTANFSFLEDKPKNVGLEGYLFPDTYKIFKDATINDVVLKMLNNLDKKLTAEMRIDIKKQGKSVYEIITMASLIEKEVRSEADMKIVSGLFWNRIKNGQGLESCASLAYILGVNKPVYSLEDTKIDSPYNTYQNRGLPPGPVSNPGLQAIKAAIYPTETSYNYFLSRPDTGETVFSRTYDEHLRNKNKFLK